MNVIKYPPYSCEIMNDCLGWNLKFKDSSNKEKNISSIEEWIAAIHEHMVPLESSADTLLSLRTLMHKAYEYMDGMFDHEFDAKKISELADVVYQKKHWQWFDGSAVPNLKRTGRSSKIVTEAGWDWGVELEAGRAPPQLPNAIERHGRPPVPARLIATVSAGERIAWFTDPNNAEDGGFWVIYNADGLPIRA